MRIEHSFVCSLDNGLHARPASILAAKAGEFDAGITLTRQIEQGPPPADVCSVLSVVGLDVHKGDTCLLVAEGDDAEAAIGALRDLIDNVLEEADAAAEADAASRLARTTRLPIMLRRPGVQHAGGQAVCGGTGMGVAVHAGGLALPDWAAAAQPGELEAELTAARSAIAAVRADLDDRASHAASATEKALLAAHAQIANDPAVLVAIRSAILNGATAPQAVVAAAEKLSATLRAAASAYVRERAIDVQDIAMQLLDRLLPDDAGTTEIELAADSVVFAETLTANQLLRMDRSYLKGLVLGAVGPTSHTVILARNFGVPCIIGVEDVRGCARSGDQAVVDGDGGFVVSPVTPGVARFYERENGAREAREARLLPLTRRPAVTADGRRLEVATNAADAIEIARAVSTGADGVGLFRTEFLYLDRDAAPSEDEQYGIYRAAVEAAAGRPVIFRTFDIGGDKPAPYMRMEEEDNPFLGCRGLRLYRRRLSLLFSQLRALLRAGADAPPGSLKIMAPMVSVPDEAAWFRQQVIEAQRSLNESGVPAAADVSVGMMIEVPSVALSVDLFCPHVDFFSIGTNDLCQYWMAADRGNASVAPLCDPHHPSFLRVLRTIVDAARAHDKWIGVCGEMGGRPRDLPFMIGLGVNEISGSSRRVAALKLATREADAVGCRKLLDAACEAGSPAEVEALLDSFDWKATGADTRPVVDVECMRLGADAASKEEAIRHAVEVMWITGRTEAPRDVEEAVWAREETYSTGLGYGFAVPHCKCDAVKAPTLTVVRLASPVEWESMDGKPVSTILLLAVPAAEGDGGGAAGHMKVFATLARRLMHESFRERLESLDDPEKIAEFLVEELGIA
ncbi:MAG: phosphoenolpyruvate--protein phosphotransferase [Phycisphaeraceae bacterium]|nr:MAG: phosphoenolpyruvate--protein phosphotransferase [Phycisphaeraceae bacterium]